MVRPVLFALVLLFPAVLSAAADHITTPLVVIRFNQPRVYYEQALYTAMNKALETKPDVRFTVINYYPPNPRLRQQAARHFQGVLANIHKMGMPQGRLSVSSEAAPDLSYSEVHVYVR